MDPAAVCDGLARSGWVREYATAFQQATGLLVGLAPSGELARPFRFRHKVNPLCRLMAQSSAGRRACQQAHAELQRRVATKLAPQVMPCFARMLEFAVPVMADGQHVGTLVVGQVFQQKPTPAQYARLARQLRSWRWPPEPHKIKTAFFQGRVISRQQLQASLRLLTRVASVLAEMAHRGRLATFARALYAIGLRRNLVQNDTAGARRNVEQAIAIMRRIGDRWIMGAALSWLRFVALVEDDLLAARAPGEEAMAIAREVGDMSLLAWATEILATHALLEGDYNRAGSLFEQALGLPRGVIRESHVELLMGLAYARLGQGDSRATHTLLRQAMDLLMQYRAPGNEFALLLAGFASVAIAEGDAARGVRLLAAVEAPLSAANDRMWRHEQAQFERDLAAAKASVDEAAFERAWAEGRAMTWEQAIQYAQKT